MSQASARLEVRRSFHTMAFAHGRVHLEDDVMTHDVLGYVL